MRQHLTTHTGQKPTKCSQCNYVFSNASDWLGNIWKHTAESNQTGSICVIMLLILQAIWELIKKFTVRKMWHKCSQCNYAASQAGHLKTHEKTHSRKRTKNAISVAMQLLTQAILRLIWKLTLEKSQTNAASVNIHLLLQAVWGPISKFTVEKTPTRGYH